MFVLSECSPSFEKSRFRGIKCLFIPFGVNFLFNLNFSFAGDLFLMNADFVDFYGYFTTNIDSAIR